MIPLFLLMGNVVILDLGHDSNRETFIVRLFTSPGQLRHEGSPKERNDFISECRNRANAAYS
jgi:hypothetical protein